MQSDQRRPKSNVFPEIYTITATADGHNVSLITILYFISFFFERYAERNTPLFSEPQQISLLFFL